MFEPIGEGAGFYKESRCFVAVNKWVSVGFFDTFCYVGICRTKIYLMSEGNLIAWPENFSLFTARITRDRFKFGRTRVSSLRISGFEMGEYAGELPRKFIRFHCLENESNEPKDHNTEEIENYPDVPQRSEVEIVVIEETETSPTKSLAVLQVTGGEKTISEERENLHEESLAVGSLECLLSSSDEGSEGLEKFLRDKLESLGGDGIENIAEVDPAEVLELSRRGYTWDVFKLSCLCLGHVAPKLPEVSLGSSKVGVTSVDLSAILEPLEGYLLSSDAEGNFFTDPESISLCMDLLETFGDSALQCGYNPCEFVDCHGYEKIRTEWEKSYKAVRIASDVESSASLSEPVFVSDRLPEQRRRPAQRPRIDISKTHHSDVAELLAGKLRSKRKTSNTESS